MTVGIARQAKAGQTACGDAAAAWVDGDQTLLCVVDGLGHGEAAATAASAALAAVAARRTQPLAAIFAHCEQTLRHTRGLAMGLARIEHGRQAITYVGVGNIRALRLGTPHRRFVNSYGIVGGGFGALFEDCQPIADGDLLLMYSDGIAEIVDPQRQVDRGYADPQALAEQLLADLADGHDDAAVLIYQV
mgnify:CR=1 FL=1